MNEKSIECADAVLSAPELPYETVSEDQKEPNEKGSLMDVYFAVSVFLLSFLIMRFTDIFAIGWATTMLMIGLILVSAVYVCWHGYTITKHHAGLLLFMIVACIPNAVFSNYGLKFFNLLFITVLQMYWLLSCCGHLSDRKESDWILLDFMIAIFLVPLTCLKKAFSFLTSFTIKRINVKTIIMVLTGFVISVPLLIIILPQLALADDAFLNLFVKMISNLDQVFSWIVTFLLTIPLFLYYYSSTYGNMFCTINTEKIKQKLELKLQSISRITPMILITMEVVLCIVYLLFVGSSVYSIYHVVTDMDIEFVYASYARQGFFELCRITVINLVVLAMIEFCIKKETLHGHRAVKRILCLETICMILTALFKMGLYINAYGLTYKRVYSTWLMLVLLGVFLIMLFRTIKKGYVILPIVRYTCICFAMLNMMNIDQVIHNTNDLHAAEIPIYEYMGL